MIHTLRFGNHYREAVKAKSYLSFTNKRGGPGTSIQIPMMHKDDEGLRSHYITLEMQIEDAPRADEIVVVLGCADGGRLHPRIGNRYIDLEELAALMVPRLIDSGQASSQRSTEQAQARNGSRPLAPRRSASCAYSMA